MRFQFLVILCFGVVLPSAMLAGLKASAILASGAVLNAIAAAAAAVMILLLVLRRMEAYPGVTASSLIAPSLAAIYGYIFVAFGILRLAHSNAVLIASFLGTLAACHFMCAVNGRTQQRRFLVVPGGRASRVRQLPHLRSRLLTSPRLPDRRNVALIADLHFDHRPEWERLLAEAAISGTPVYHYKQVWEATTGKVQIEHLSENSLGALIPGLGYRKIKRMADLLVSLALLPVLLPFLLAVAVLIRLDSPGPALFRQKRMGHRGKVFEVVKFRTMSVAANGEDAAVSITRSDDDRITRIGAFLRRTRIDELPQIVNIVRGEMSWIGPRPEAISLSRLYEAELPFYRYRHIVRPGITGWAQVNQGHVTELGEIDNKLQFDFYYIKNFSYWIDLLIVFRTLRVVLTGFGAK